VVRFNELRRKGKSFAASGSVMHQVLFTLLRIIFFAGRGKLNFNLTEKSAFSHYRRSCFRRNLVSTLNFLPGFADLRSREGKSMPTGEETFIYQAQKAKSNMPVFQKLNNQQEDIKTKAHLMNKIKAKHLATGDRVRFSRDGWQIVERLTNCNSISVSFMFSDGIIRKLEANQEYVVEQGSEPPAPQPGQIMRLNRESNRISICASHSLFDLSDISESFRAIKQKDGYSNSAAAFQELERGATLHTHEAIYRMPLKWSGEATRETSN
jgi:hypothetical protein